MTGPIAFNTVHPPQPVINKRVERASRTKEFSVFQAKYPQEFINANSHLTSWSVKKIFLKGFASIINKITGGLERIILPAVHIFKNDKSSFARLKSQVKANPKNTCSFISFKTADGILIDGMIQWYNSVDFKRHQATPQLQRPFKNRKWIIFFNPNAMCYEQLLQSGWVKEYCQRSRCNILLFNNRGVVHSQGYPKSAKELILDGDAAYELLLDHGVDSSSIAIHGFSLGGAIGTQVRALHPDGPMANEKSFSSIGRLIQGLTSRFLPSVLARLIGKFAGAILEEAGWEMDSLKKWPEIKGHKWIITGTNDNLMRGVGRLYDALKQQLEGYRKVNKINSRSSLQMIMNEKLKETLNHIKSEGTGHCDALTPEAEEAHFDHLKKAFIRP